MYVCWNNVYRKVFNMNIWESVKCTQLFCGRLDFVHISPGALVKNGKKCYKADFFQNSYVISCVITYQKPKKILLELISEIASQNV